ncbi:MAG TPA: IS4 family transposase [Chloroflexota bacterium]
MSTIPQVAAALESVLGSTAEELGRPSGFVRRARRLSGASFVQTLVVGWLGKPEASLSELTHTAAALGCPISAQGLAQRFTPPAAALLEGVLGAAVSQVVSADPVALPLLARFTGVVLGDCTVVALPDALAGRWAGTGERTGHNQAALKLYVQLDLLGGQLSGPHLHAGRTSDRTALAQAPALPAGTLSIRDLGFFGLCQLARDGQAGRFWLSRLRAGTVVCSAAGPRQDLPRWLATQPDRVDQPVTLGVDERLPARLLAVRVPPAVAAERRRQLHAEARHKGQTVSATRLALADWTILVTNVPAALLTLAEALVLYRARWQIERLFALWKQYGRLGHARSANPWRILCEIYAKLLALLVQHWVCLLRCWDYPERSLLKAAAALRAHASLLLAALAGCLPLPAALAQITRTLGPSCRMSRRRAAPHTFQFLLRGADGR